MKVYKIFLLMSRKCGIIIYNMLLFDNIKVKKHK